MDSLDNLTPEQLDERETIAKAQLAKIQAFKEQVRLARHKKHVDDVRALIREHGLQVHELFPEVRLAAASSDAAGAAVQGAPKRGRKEGEVQGPATVKFRGPNGEVWKGRGLIAKWMEEHQAKGGKLLDLAEPGLTWDGELTRDTESKEMRPPKWVQLLLDEGVTKEQLKAGLHRPK